jgi:hypothetical protein
LSRRPVHLAITAVPKIPLTPEKSKNPTKTFPLISREILQIFSKTLSYFSPFFKFLFLFLFLVFFSPFSLFLFSFSFLPFFSFSLPSSSFGPAAPAATGAPPPACARLASRPAAPPFPPLSSGCAWPAGSLALPARLAPRLQQEPRRPFPH